MDPSQLAGSIVAGLILAIILALATRSSSWLRRMVARLRERWAAWRRRRAIDRLLVYVLELGRPVQGRDEQSQINRRFGVEQDANRLLFGGRLPLMVEDKTTGARRLTDRGRERAEAARR